MKKCSKGMPCDITGITWEMLEDSHGIHWPFREGDVLDEDERRLYGDGCFFTPSRKAQFKFEAPKENPLPVTQGFPYVFNTGRGSVGQWHTQSRTSEVRFIGDVSAKEAYLYMNPDTAAAGHIEENNWVRVHSANGQQADLRVRISEQVRPGELYAPIHYIECNRLTPSIYDPYSKEPSYKATPVWFEKIEGGNAYASDKN